MDLPAAVATMFTIGDVCKEIIDVDTLLAVRSSGGLDCTRLQANLVTQIASKITGIKQFQTSDALNVTRAINDSSLTREVKSQLTEAVDDRVARTSSVVLTGHANHVKKGSPGSQLLVATNRYLTAKDWAWLRDPRHDTTRRLTVLVNRSRKCGIRTLDEQTKRWFIVIIVSVEFELKGSWPSYDEVYGWVCDFTRMHDASKQPYGLQTILEYPMDPADLPADVWSYAYEVEDPPIFMDIPNFSAIGRHVPLRSTSGLLSKKTQGDYMVTPEGNKIQLIRGTSVNRRNSGGRYGGTVSSSSSRWAPSPQPLCIMDEPAGGSWGHDGWDYYRSSGKWTHRDASRSHSPSPSPTPSPSMHSEDQRSNTNAASDDAAAMSRKVSMESMGNDAQSLAKPLQTELVTQHPALTGPVHSRVAKFQGTHVSDLKAPPRKTTEEIEQAAFDLLTGMKKGRDAKRVREKAAGVDKKPAAAGDVKRRPSSSELCDDVAKRPAAEVAGTSAKATGGTHAGGATSDVTSKYPKVIWDPAYKSNKHAWLSKHYTAAKKVADTAGKTSEQIYEFAQKVRANANTAWDANH